MAAGAAVLLELGQLGNAKPLVQPHLLGPRETSGRSTSHNAYRHVSRARIELTIVYTSSTLTLEVQRLVLASAPCFAGTCQASTLDAEPPKNLARASYLTRNIADSICGTIVILLSRYNL